jgi:sRNA-binding regulator protein Hfq
VPAVTPAGPRKLVRPVLPGGSPRGRGAFRSRQAPLLTHQRPQAGGRIGSPHVESFYLQKQVQAQTPMVFMLEGEERLEGIIEWYDSDAIKIRSGSRRILLYKAAIKYLHKATEQHG